MEGQEGWKDRRDGRTGGMEGQEGWKDRRDGRTGGMEGEEGWKDRRDGRTGGMEGQEGDGRSGGRWDAWDWVCCGGRSRDWTLRRTCEKGERRRGD